MPPDAPAPRTLTSTHDGLMALITGRPVDGRPSGAASDVAGDLVVSDGRATAAERVHVYAHMYRARIYEALESQFPRLARWLGADVFDDIAFAYVTDRPSRHPSLRFLGQGLPGWLAAPPTGVETAEGRHPALADLAQLEWARADVFDAADQTPLSIDAVRAWPAARFAELPLRLIGAHRLVSVAHPVAALWDALDVGATRSAHDLDILAQAAADPRSESFLVWRQGINVFHRAVDADERAALHTIATGTTFGAVCDQLIQICPPDEATARAFNWLSTWTADELLLASAS